MPVCRSSGAREMWVIEFYIHPAPLALRTDNVDSNDLIFAQSLTISARRTLVQYGERKRPVITGVERSSWLGSHTLLVLHRNVPR
jgi:hypothetical protein